MDKVWFKLRQTDYPPPTPESMGTRIETGPLCLGHIVPDLRHLDFPINRNEIEPFSRNMLVYTTSAHSFRWHDTLDKERSSTLGGGAPVLAAVGLPVTATADVKAVFKASVANNEEYERLDTYLVQVTRAYIADCLEGNKVAEHVKKSSSLGTWSMFIITGLKIARVGSRSTSSSKGIDHGVGFEADIPAIVSAQVELGVSLNKEKGMESEKHSDFVWAIRLAKIRKGLLMDDWSLEPYTKKATFSADESQVNVELALENAGESNFRIFKDEDLKETFVILNGDALVDL
ncbi:hypothetical protein ColKHC_05201 [Colletotrichum higginsianum]|nr:hypothetical protein ColKHC_05201 [Colletotrichum higginsianum]